MLLHTPSCETGSDAPHFQLEDATGESFSLDSILGGKGVVVAFISNHCPYVVAVAEEIAKVAEELEKIDVAFVAIMPNNYQYVESDSPENMLKFSEKYSFNFPYLVDEDQSVAKAYGAVCTPDFFGVNSDGKIQYRGRIENGDLLNAMREISSTGEGPIEQHPSKGCSIKWR